MVVIRDVCGPFLFLGVVFLILFDDSIHTSEKINCAHNSSRAQVSLLKISEKFPKFPEIAEICFGDVATCIGKFGCRKLGTILGIPL